MSKKNAIFNAGPYWRLNACVGNNGGPHDFSDYSKGYFAATERLINSVEEDPMLIDDLVYPVVFSFRHALELAAKHLVNVLPRIWGERAKSRLTHHVVDNWKIARRYLERDSWFYSSGHDIGAVDRIIHDVIEIDASGEVFRFPMARSGTQHLRETSIINVGRLCKPLMVAKGAFAWWSFAAERLWDVRCEVYSRLAS